MIPILERTSGGLDYITGLAGYRSALYEFNPWWFKQSVLINVLFLATCLLDLEWQSGTMIGISLAEVLALVLAKALAMKNNIQFWHFS